MEAFNSSASLPFGVPQSSHRFGHEDRNEIKRRAEADFLKLYMDHGGRHRGKALLCIFHEDRTPSARIHKGRFRCFSCNISLDVIEFVQRAQRSDFKTALTYLGDRYGVPIQSSQLPPKERAQYARQQRDLKRDLPVAFRWRHAALLMAEFDQRQLKAALADPECGPADSQGILRGEQVLAYLRGLDGCPLVEEYRSWREDNPQLTAALVHAIAVRERAERRALNTYWESMERGAK